MTAKTTVTITEAQTELGELLAYHWVTVRLVHGGQGGVVDGQVIGSAGSAKFQLDDEGSGSFAVYPNAAITPAGTYYAVSVDGTSPLVARLLNVPTSGPVDWADEAIQVDEPSPPTTVPAPTSGDAFDVLRVDSAGTRYELAPAEVSGENVDVDGTPLPTVLTASFSAVYSAVSAEASARAAAVTAEATARGNADTAESNARIAGDAASTKAATGLQDVLRAEATERLSVLPRFQLCGDSGAPHSGSAYTAPALPDFTTGAYWRFNVTARPDFDTDLTGLFYSEIITQTHDAGVGSWDNYEIAVQWIYDTDTESWRPTLFMEWTEIDGLAETHSLATESASSAAGVTYPAWEFQPGVPTEIAVHLDFANGDGNWDLSFWRRIHFGTADATFDDAEWVRISRAIGTGATSIDTGVTAPHGFGMGDGNLELFSLTIRDEGPAGTVLADPTAADAYAEGDGQPFDDPAGNTWTPGANAHVAVPSTGSGVALGETSGTAYRGDRGKTAYDHSQVTAANPHGVTAAMLSGLPWPDRARVACVIDYPSTPSSTWLMLATACIGSGYAITADTNDQSFTYARLPLRAGTYTLRFTRRGSTSSGVATFTLGGSLAGTIECYWPSNLNDMATNPITGIVVPADGFYDLVVTNPTKNPSSSNYRIQPQVIDLYRTGA